MIFTKQSAKPVVSAAAATIQRRQALIAGGILVAVGIAMISAVVNADSKLTHFPAFLPI